ncbi:hypothetical protein [Comamonas sp. JC664]
MLGFEGAPLEQIAQDAALAATTCCTTTPARRRCTRPCWHR